MRYMGSKGRHARHIVPILMDGHDPKSPYVEPFVGGGNMIDKIPAPWRIGRDLNRYSVAALHALSIGWKPPESIDVVTYELIKNNPDDFPEHLVGYVGFGCSFGGKWFGGYARGGGRDHQNEAFRTCVKQGVAMQGVLFQPGGYDDFEYIPGSTVYMDPPYQSTTGYATGGFDHNKFWSFCSELAETCRVFVSEYHAPPNWLPVWERTVSSSVDLNTGAKTATEKLFTKWK